MKIHTCIVSYNRLELTKQAISSYLETVSVPFSLVVVDNGSEPEVRQWLMTEYDYSIVLLNRNRYPGFATNRGWEMAPRDADFLHRADNDFAFLPGWCEEVERVFRSKKVGQVGLRTGAEEERGQYNVGGNNVIRRKLWDKGLRYDERPWPQLREEVGPGHTEDSLFSPAVTRMHYTWTRVKKPCIVPLAAEDGDDPYYAETWADRGILDWATNKYVE